MRDAVLSSRPPLDAPLRQEVKSAVVQMTIATATPLITLVAPWRMPGRGV